jgi:hypothetical protein
MTLMTVGTGRNAAHRTMIESRTVADAMNLRS